MRTLEALPCRHPISLGTTRIISYCVDFVDAICPQAPTFLEVVAFASRGVDFQSRRSQAPTSLGIMAFVACGVDFANTNPRAPTLLADTRGVIRAVASVENNFG